MTYDLRPLTSPPFALAFSIDDSRFPIYGCATWEHGDWSLTSKPEQTIAILQSHAEIMKGLK